MLARVLRSFLLLTSAFALVHCAWIVGFEPSYSVEIDGGRSSDGATDGSPGTDLDAAPQRDAGAFGEPTVLVRGEATPINSVAVDDQTIYWTVDVFDGGVRAVGKDGGAATTLPRAVPGAPLEEIVALPGDTLYTRIGGVTCSTQVACGPTLTAGAFSRCPHDIIKLRTDGRRLYLLTYDRSKLHQWVYVVSKGCPAMPLVTERDAGLTYSTIAPDRAGNRVFAVTGSNIDCFDLASDAIVRTASGNVLEIAADDTHLYWLTPTEVHRCTLGSNVACTICTGDEVVTKTAPGAQPTLLVDDTSLYWLRADGVSTVAKDAPPGTTETLLSTNQSTPVALAIDPTGVYWANSGDGTIMKLSRR